MNDKSMRILKLGWFLAEKFETASLYDEEEESHSKKFWCHKNEGWGEKSGKENP